MTCLLQREREREGVGALFDQNSACAYCVGSLGHLVSPVVCVYYRCGHEQGRSVLTQMHGSSNGSSVHECF